MKTNDVQGNQLAGRARRAGRAALCLLAAAAMLLTAAGCSNEPTPEESSSVPVSSEASSTPSSKEEPSSTPESSEPESSEEESSEPVSSQAPSSKPSASSKPAESSKPVESNKPVESSKPAESSEPAASDAVSSEPVDAAAAAGLPTGYQAKFADAYKQNSSVVGKITIPGTKLDYYVAQSSDNNFYIDHNLDKQYYAWGNPYLDYRCSVAPGARYANIVLYGHSDDKNGLQFSATKQYKNLDFYKNHPTITFNTVYQDETYKVVGMFGENVDQANSFQYWNQLVFPDQAAFDTFVNEVKSRSYITMPVDCQYGDEFITLSTCVSTSTKHSRYVTVARKVRAGESASVDTSAATVNASQKAPSGALN